jgi:hypothetical protein
MTYDRMNPATPPQPNNYKATAELDGQRPDYGNKAALTCTKCDEVIPSGVDPETLGDYKYLQQVTAQHNARKHPDMLWVFTSSGWMPATELIPDPVAQINKVIDASARHQGSPPSFLNK